MRILEPIAVGEGDPCPRCFKLAWNDQIRPEAVMPLPPDDMAPLAAVHRTHRDYGPCCFDCGAADTIVKMGYVGRPDRTLPGDADKAFEMARIVVANDRQEQLRLPGAPLGMVYHGIVRPSAKGDLERHHEWMTAQGLPWYRDNFSSKDT